ncbi:hypothetical protein G4V62_11215 [Bacillaceae bacterium SIJ1]|uniref:hypothetical protein n=1 Tax=Litoribacterium kuwaitense TaxID=1398745 RepID=UPI0013ED09C9|nr:hypothetical protein [Litoribacterium kuwaitense]NGP45498.1 hypothetical protein [Litoribacterium kuwaitense]
MVQHIDSRHIADIRSQFSIEPIEVKRRRHGLVEIYTENGMFQGRLFKSKEAVQQVDEALRSLATAGSQAFALPVGWPNAYRYCSSFAGWLAIYPHYDEQRDLRTDRPTALFSALARMHRQTKQPLTISHAFLKESGDAWLKAKKTTAESLDALIAQYDQMRYPSPFVQRFQHVYGQMRQHHEISMEVLQESEEIVKGPADSVMALEDASFVDQGRQSFVPPATLSHQLPAFNLAHLMGRLHHSTIDRKQALSTYLREENIDSLNEKLILAVLLDGQPLWQVAKQYEQRNVSKEQVWVQRMMNAEARFAANELWREALEQTVSQQNEKEEAVLRDETEGLE